MGGGDVYKEWKLLLKGKKSGGEGGQGRCERRTEAFVKILKKIFFFFLGGWGGGGGGGGGGSEWM